MLLFELLLRLVFDQLKCIDSVKKLVRAQMYIREVDFKISMQSVVHYWNQDFLQEIKFFSWSKSFIKMVSQPSSVAMKKLHVKLPWELFHIPCHSFKSGSITRSQSSSTTVTFFFFQRKQVIVAKFHFFFFFDR